MTSVQIVQIKCPNCGGQLNSVGGFAQKRKCAYCKEEFHVTGTMDREMETPERMVPFKTTKDDFEKEVLDFLAQEELAPNNIFEYTSFEDVEGIYLPMFLYEGRYECTWNCSVGYEENESKRGVDAAGKPTVKNERVIKYRPMNGTNKGNYAFVCIAYEGDEIKPELAEYAQTFPYNASSAMPFDGSLLEGYNFLINNIDKESVWDRWGDESIQEIAEEESLDTIPGDKVKDFSFSVATEPRHDGRLVFIPFWSIYYTYNNEQHFVLMDGTGDNGVYGTTPIDEAREKKFKLWKKLPQSLFIGTCLLSLLLVFILDFATALGVFIPLFVISLILHFIGSAIIKKTTEASRKARQDSLNNILNAGK